MSATRLVFSFTLFLTATMLFSQNSIADIVGYWRFEDPNAPGLDSSGNGLGLIGNAGLMGDVPVNPVPFTGATNAFSERFDQVGQAQSMSTNDNSLLDFGFSDAFTIEGWLRPTNSIGLQAQFIVEKRQTGLNTEGYVLYLNNAGTLGFTGVNSFADRFDLSSSTVLTPTDWYHFAAVYDGNGGANLYVDSLLEDSVSGAMTGGTFANTNRFLVGESQFPGAVRFDGGLDELRISNTALTPAGFLNASTVPEPSSLFILGVVLVGFLGRRIRMNS